jgi:hypothetical protein
LLDFIKKRYKFYLEYGKNKEEEEEKYKKMPGVDRSKYA